MPEPIASQLRTKKNPASAKACGTGLRRQKIIIEGIVQGVGFRPFVHQLAERFGLAGSVCNDSRGVTIEVEGAAAILDQFVAAIGAEKPAKKETQPLRKPNMG